MGSSASYRQSPTVCRGGDPAVPITPNAVNEAVAVVASAVVCHAAAPPRTGHQESGIGNRELGIRSPIVNSPSPISREIR